ncbi:MAG: diguanylate cyclase [Nitrospinae bacterium]|nr:diguanylate cyclase [Nitrospinota bacterium]MBL7020175.1 diguanylate cyclase [Nitrospinaceae bacterium]
MALDLEKLFPTNSMTLMIVDDTKANIDVLRQTLAESGYKITVALNGETALDLIPKLKPDLILLDVMMPGINGYEVCKHLKKDPELSDIPIIFITAKGDTEDIIEGFNVGAVDFIMKPFKQEEVCARVKTHLTLSAAIKKLTLDSETDSLTGLFNRRTFLKRMENEVMRCKRNQKSFSILFGDIDFFKKINDTHGHLAGDAVLVNISTLLNTEKREIDQVARWGGEEFLILLPETDLKGAVLHGNKIRELVSAKSTVHEGKEIHTSMSFGASEYSGDGNIEKTIDQADQRLYLAKNSGRNKVVSEDA